MGWLPSNLLLLFYLFFLRVVLLENIIYHKRFWSLVWLHSKLTGRINRHIIQSHSSYFPGSCDERDYDAWQKPAHWIDYFYPVVQRGPCSIDQGHTQCWKLPGKFPEAILVIQGWHAAILWPPTQIYEALFSASYLHRNCLSNVTMKDENKECPSQVYKSLAVYAWRQPM